MLHFENLAQNMLKRKQEVSSYSEAKTKKRMDEIERLRKERERVNRLIDMYYNATTIEARNEIREEMRRIGFIPTWV